MTDRIKVTIYKDGQLLARKNAEMAAQAYKIIESWQHEMERAKSREILEKKHERIMGCLYMLDILGLIDWDERLELESNEINHYSDERMRLIREGARHGSK